MNSTPLLCSYNCFDVLQVEQINDIEMETPDVQRTKKPPISTSPTDSPIRIRRPKWERLLPKEFVIAATENNPTALKLKVEIETTDTAEKKSVSALVDCGATGEVTTPRVPVLSLLNSLSQFLYSMSTALQTKQVL